MVSETRQEVFEHIGKKVFYGQYLKGVLVSCYPTTVFAVGESAAMLEGVSGYIYFGNIFKSEKDFLETCLKLTP